MNQEAKNEFWESQFSEEITPQQLRFDFAFGIVVPILCLVFDPFVFRSGFLGGSGYLNSIQIFAYISIGLGIISLAIWLLSGITSEILIGAISGLFFVGALLAFSLSLALLPYSIFGLIFVIGVFGFTPFLTAFVFLRNGTRAFRRIQPKTSSNVLVGAMLLGVAFGIGIPIAVNWKTSELVSQSIYIIIHSEKEEEINSAVDKLQAAFWCSNSCYDEIVWAYSEEKSDIRKEMFLKTYMELTGKSIQGRLFLLND